MLQNKISIWVSDENQGPWTPREVSTHSVKGGAWPRICMFSPNRASVFIFILSLCLYLSITYQFLSSFLYLTSIYHLSLFELASGTRDQIANVCWITQKAREFWKNIYFCFIDYAKHFIPWITANCGKFLKRWEYHTCLPYLSPEKPVCRSRSNS